MMMILMMMILLMMILMMTILMMMILMMILLMMILMMTIFANICCFCLVRYSMSFRNHVRQSRAPSNGMDALTEERENHLRPSSRLGAQFQGPASACRR